MSGDGEQDWQLSAYSPLRFSLLFLCQYAFVAFVLLLAQRFVQLPSPWGGIAFAVLAPVLAILLGFVVFPPMRGWLTVGQLCIVGQQLRFDDGVQEQKVDTWRPFELYEARVGEGKSLQLIVTVAQDDRILKFSYSVPRDAKIELPHDEQSTTEGVLAFDPRATVAHQWLRAQYDALRRATDPPSLH